MRENGGGRQLPTQSFSKRRGWDNSIPKPWRERCGSVDAPAGWDHVSLMVPGTVPQHHRARNEEGNLSDGRGGNHQGGLSPV